MEVVMLENFSVWVKRKLKQYKLWLFKDSLKDKSFSVFVRQSNKSKTDLELFIENTLIQLGATVHPSNQKSCLEFMASGENLPISQANFQILGTLIIVETSVDPGDWYDYSFSYRVIELSNGTIVNSGCLKFNDTDFGYKPSPVLKGFADSVGVTIAQTV